MNDLISSSERTIAFGFFSLIPERQLLLENGAPVRLGSRAFAILVALVERPGEIIEKHELIERVWPNIHVDENTLRVHIAGLRRALGDGQPGRRYLTNVPGRGYRFVAQLQFAEPESPPTPPPERPSNHNLPLSKSRVVGRAGVIDALCDQLSRQRLITIVGAGGVGKTTVALAVAETLLPAYPDGVRFVDLAPVEAPRSVYGVLGAALGIVVDIDNPDSGLIDFLADKRMLIVLDSCEHVIETTAYLAERLVRDTSALRILATSREPLRADGERVHRLPSLDVPSDPTALTAAEALAYPAVQLFVERAAGIVDGFELSDSDAPAVADVCRKLGGIALAIELAAARIDAFGVRQLGALLDDRFRILGQGRRTAQPRHRSLSAALDWSYAFLPESQQRVLCRLSVFAGAFTLESAIAVAGDDGTDVVDDVANLVAKSLIAADVSGPTVQYRLLDTTRAYALQKLVEAGKFEESARRHAQHHFDWFKRAETEWTARSTGTKWLEDNGRDVDDVRSALNWAFSANGDATVGVALTVTSIPLWLELSLIHECRAHVERALAAQAVQPDHDERDELKLRLAHGMVLRHTARSLSKDEGSLARTAALAERLDDGEALSQALFQWSAHCLSIGNFRETLAIAERCCALADSSGSVSTRVIGCLMAGDALRHLGDYAGAVRHLETIFALPAEPDSRWVFSNRLMSFHVYSSLLWLRGFPDQALRCAQQALSDTLATGNSLMNANMLGLAACPIALLVGDIAEAERSVALLMDNSAKPALNHWSALGRCYQGQLLFARGDLTGLQVLQTALDTLREAGFALRYTISLVALAEGLTAVGRFPEAHTAIGEALERVERDEERWCLPELLRVKGELLRSDGSSETDKTAEDCFRQALDLARQHGALSWELRTATSLARLWRDEGKAAAARDLLSEVYDRFTEGFDTLDLRTAQALIGELG